MNEALLNLGKWRSEIFIGIVLAIFPVQFISAQILMSGGTYSQNFNSLTNSGNPNWTNNVTLAGWYLSRGNADGTNYTLGAGTSSTGSFYSFATNGVNSASDKALGSVAASGVVYARVIRLLNDTAYAQTNITISYTGEQWRSANGSSAVTNILAFTYQIASTPLTNADAVNSQTWTSLTALDFDSPFVNTGGGIAVDGNAATNRQVFSNIVLTGAVVQPGQECFLRWRDVDDGGSDAGLAIDDLTVSFQPDLNTQAPQIVLQPASQATGEKGFAIFNVTAIGNPTPSIQWRFNGTNISGATGATLSLYNVSSNQAGIYDVVSSSVAGAVTSSPALLIVTPASFDATNGQIRYLTYNVNGNGVADWSTNTAQAQAIGRELIYFNADIITFNEIPYTNTWQMDNWIKAFMPGFYLATNSGTDGFIRNVVASRWPIVRSQSWLNNSSLTNFGYDGRFPRDLFEAQIAVTNWPLPLHVFVAHLKATTGSTLAEKQNDADQRAAQCNSISNFLVNTFLAGTNGAHPYILSGDLNEDAFFPDSAYVSGHPVQRLVNAATGLQLATPVNRFGNSVSNAYTESIRGNLDTRFDYILPCAMLLSNVAAMEIFRTDLLTNFPSNLFSNDDKIASDHLPVLMVFNNPFNTPFKLLSIARTNQSITLKWESQNNRNYSVETSTNLTAWSPLASNLFTTTTNSPFVFSTNNVSDKIKFFRIYRAP